MLFSAGRQNLTRVHPLPRFPHLPLYHVVSPLPALLHLFLLSLGLFSFSLTFPQSYIKSYQPLEEHIKVLGPVKSYKLSALQYHYMFNNPPHRRHHHSLLPPLSQFLKWSNLYTQISLEAEARFCKCSCDCNRWQHNTSKKRHHSLQPRPRDGWFSCMCCDCPHPN